MPDKWEIDNGFNINVDDSADDKDGDDLNNLAEFENGTQPDVKDSDSDGYNDGLEVLLASDPNDENSSPSPAPTGLNLSVSSTNPLSITATWNGDKDNGEYKLCYGTTDLSVLDEGDTFDCRELGTEVDVEGTEHTVSENLEPNMTYYFAVSDWSQTSVGLLSNAVSIRTPHLLSAPTGFEVRKVASQTTYLSWDSVEGASGYNICYATQTIPANVMSGDCTSVENGQWTGKVYDKTNTLIRDLTFGKTYYFRVVAIASDDSYGSPSDEKSITISSVPTPTNFKATSDSEKIYLSWDAVEGVSNYVVCMAEEPVAEASYEHCVGLTGGVFETPILDTRLEISNSSLSSYDLSLDPEKTYYFRLAAEDSNGNIGSSSDQVSEKLKEKSLTTQAENKFTILEDGVTDIPENVSYYLRSGDSIFFGTKNGKIITLDSSTLSRIGDTVLLSTKDFRHVNAKVDYLYQKNNELFVAVTVKPPKNSLNIADAYVLRYQIDSGKITSLIEYIQLKSDTNDGYADGPPVTGMYVTSTHLYLTMNGNFAIYDLSSRPVKELSFYWIYGGDQDLCGIGNNVYTQSRRGHITKYSIKGDTLELEKQSSGERSYSMSCINDFIITDKYVYDGNLEVLHKFEEKIDPNQVRFTDNNMYIYKYYPKEYSSCNIKTTIINLGDFSYSTSDEKIFDAELIASYTPSCPHGEIWASGGSIYKIPEGYSNILLKGTSNFSKAFNLNNSLEIKKINSFTGRYIYARNNNNHTYLSFQNKIIKIDPEKQEKNDVLSIKDSDNTLSSFIVEDDFMYYAYHWRASSIENIFKAPILQDGSLGGVEKSLKGGFHRSHISHVCSENIFSVGIQRSMTSNYAVYNILDKNSLTAEPTERYGIHHNSSFCFKNKPYDYYRSGSYSSIYPLVKQMNNTTEVWKTSDSTQYTEGLGDYFWNSEDSLVFRNSKNGVYLKVDPESGTAISATKGLDVPFSIEKTDKDNMLDYIIYNRDGSIKKQSSSPCVPALDTTSFPSMINDVVFINGYANPGSSEKTLCIIR
ncbi:MAG: hypothetical protein CSB47_09010 [Proteobacteria bacterium]|nr:MAG: hypothetical protein CSB47_09010 [Pseudomonadota bacterium]